MRDYQKKRKNPGYMPETLYRRTLALVRDYPRLTQEREQLLGGTEPEPEVARYGRGMKRDETAARAAKLAQVTEDCAAVERALEALPTEYRQGILDNILTRVPQRDLAPPADRATWSRWRVRFLWAVARNKGWV